MRIREGLVGAACAAAVAVASLTATAATAATAAAQPAYAPLEQPGPALSVPISLLKASLQCEPSVRNAKVEPVLLNPATGVSAAENYSWNWEPALQKLGIPWCAYTAPHDTLDNIETSGEYLVYAIRTMYAIAGRKIAVMGHSQGGMSMRWSLRFWPDTRKMVDDVIGFSGSNHGTTALGGDCGIGCPPADWQQAYQSNFIRALNSGAETFPGISYTEIYTHTDEVVQPADNNDDASAALHTGGGMITNVATQNICPADVYEHLTVGTVDPVAYAIAVDALTHTGPAQLSRIPPSVCSQLVMPGVDLAELNAELEILSAAPSLGSVDVGPAAGVISGSPVVDSEPPLACYVFAECPAVDTLKVTATPSKAVLHKRLKVTFKVTVDVDGVVSPVPGASVLAGNGRHLSTGEDGRVTARIAYGRVGKRRVIATAQEYKPGRATVRVSRPRKRNHKQR